MGDETRGGRKGFKSKTRNRKAEGVKWLGGVKEEGRKEKGEGRRRRRREEEEEEGG